MPDSKPFKQLVQIQAGADVRFAEALRQEGIDAIQSGDVDTGATILRNYLENAVR